MPVLFLDTLAKRNKNNLQSYSPSYSAFCNARNSSAKQFCSVIYIEKEIYDQNDFYFTLILNIILITMKLKNLILKNPILHAIFTQQIALEQWALVVKIIIYNKVKY